MFVEGAYLAVNLIHGHEVPGEIGEIDVTLHNGHAVDTRALEDLGHIVESGTLVCEWRRHISVVPSADRNKERTV